MSGAAGLRYGNPPAARGRHGEAAHLAKTVLFLATTRNSPTIEEQRTACATPDDVVVEAGRYSLIKLPDGLSRNGMGFEPGDTLKIYDLTCIGVSTSTLIRTFVRTLGAGINIEICCPEVRIEACTSPSDCERLLGALDAHWARLHGIKIKEAAKVKLGRKPRLHDEQLPVIREMLARPGASTTSVARELNVGRSTLFDFLSRHGVRTKQP